MTVVSELQRKRAMKVDNLIKSSVISIASNEHRYVYKKQHTSWFFSAIYAANHDLTAQLDAAG